MERRLQSFKLPRDLTLGGSRPTRTFTPNLNVARNRNKNVEAFQSNRTDKSPKPNQEKDTKEIVRKYVKNERYIQTSSVFAQGIGTDVVTRRKHETRSYSSRDTAIKLVCDNQKNVKDENRIRREYEVDDLPVISDYDSDTDDDDALSYNQINKTRSVTCKEEVKSEDNDNINVENVKIEKDVVPKEFVEIKECSNSNPSISLWRIPESFPSKPVQDDSTADDLQDYRLRDMLEGQIGKLCIRKSGKMEVRIGSMKYSLVAPSGYFQERKIVAINAEKEEAVAVGHIKYNFFSLKPCWENVTAAEQ